MSYFKNVKISDNIATVSTLNANDANVAATVTWSGTYEDIADKTAIQLISKYDQETQVCICQSIDGVNSTITDSWLVEANEGFSTAVASVAPYYKIMVTNRALSNVAQGSIVSAATAVFNPLPRALSQEDGLKTTVVGSYDSYGFGAENTPNGELRVVEPFRLVGTQFTGTTFDTNFWSNAGSGTITQSGDLTLDTTAVTNGTSTVTSVRVARYVPACANRFRSQITLGDVGQTNNSRKWGALNTTDGAYFELDGETLYVVTLKNSTPTRVASANWNGNKILPTLTNCNTWEIYWNNKSVWFTINDILAHKVTATTATWVNTLNLPIKLSNTNTLGLDASHTLVARTASISRLGREKTASTYKHISGAATTICKYSAGVLHKVIVNTPGTLCTIYDSTGAASGTIAIIDTNKTTGGVGDYTYDASFFNGLTLVTTGSSSITVVYE